MSQRSTPNWVESETPCEDVFGETGAIGDKGEPRAQRILTKLGFNVSHIPNDKKMQLKGWDLILEYIHGIDVKTNLRGNDICVDKIKIWKTQASMWFHLSPTDDDNWCMYYVRDMQRYLKEHKIKPTPTNNGSLVYYVPRTEIEKW